MSYHPILSIFHVSAPSIDPLLLQSTYSILYTVQRNASISSLFFRNNAESPKSWRIDQGHLSVLLAYHQICLSLTVHGIWKELTRRYIQVNSFQNYEQYGFILYACFLGSSESQTRFLFLESYSQESVALMMLSLVIS